MTQNGTKPSLTGRQLKGAALVAADEDTDVEIASACGVSRSTVNRWRGLPEFQAEVAKQEQAILDKALRLPIARKHRRLTVLNDLHEKALAVIGARQKAYTDEDGAIGGETGLIVRDIKAVGSGHGQEIVDVWGVDVSLMREIRSLEEQAAKETGQWSEKVSVSGSLKREYVILTSDDTDVEAEP